jgi:hypothetical protein
MKGNHMQNIDTRPAVADKAPGIVHRLRSRIAAGTLIVAALVIGAVSPASASTSSTDLTGGAGDTFFTTITAYFTGHVLPSVLVLLALMVGVGVLIKWGKRAAKSS